MRFKSKIILITFFTLMCCTLVQAQDKSRKQSAPSQKEIDDAMKGLQQIQDGMSPEEKKMMEQMGVKMPGMQSMPKMTAGQMQQAMELANSVVPPKDEAAIASIAKSPLSNSSLPAYLAATHEKVLSQLKPVVKTKGEEVYKAINLKVHSAYAVGNFAAGLWMAGKGELALYVMGKACMDDPSLTDNLNNYASMLSMSGAEQLAIPLLDKLNKQFPKNSTILNNLGQAWFGLGDIPASEQYLDSTIRLYPAHSQANRTKSSIEESKGNTDAAIATMKKSIREAWSEDKQDQLSRLGYEFSDKDLRLPFKPVPDPLGLEKFVTPAIPKTVEESVILENEWKQFDEACLSKIQGLEALSAPLQTVASEARKKRENDFLNANTTGDKLQHIPVFAQRATLKLQAMSGDTDGSYERDIKNLQAELVGYKTKQAQLTKAYNAGIDKLNKEEAKQDGEGKANADFCPRFVALKNEYLKSYNTEWEQIHNALVEAYRRKFNQETYYQQYILWPEDFAVTKLNTQLSWLNILYTTNCLFISSPVCGPEKEAKPFKGGALPDFDDIHCEYHSELKTPVGTISMDCSRLTAELDLDVVKMGIKQDMNKEGFSDQFMGCSVEVGGSHKIGSHEFGPLTAEASVNGSVKAEFDRNGLKELTVKASAEIQTDVDINTGVAGDVHVTAKAGVDAQISLISGHGSVEGDGVLKGLTKKF